ncbi:inhibitor kappa B [Elysia marginata]|uniref:Inhibitor kappa B n=1 Tax=Elysia marginata TaxID=1093978 RepID=A0AAV4EUN3_9GAST|nr:inhibitor kappa B [Elysia marginata]
MAHTTNLTSGMDAGDKTNSDRLFEQNDSGLGSMPRGLTSLDLTIEDDHLTTSSGHQNSACPETSGTGHLTSLTSGLLNLKLDARQKSDIVDRSGHCSPDPERLDLLERSAVDTDTQDSGNYSITTVSLAGTDLMTSSQQPGVEHTSDLAPQRDLFSTPHSSPALEESNTVYISPAERVALYQGDADGDNWLHLSIIHGHTDLAATLIKLAPDYLWLSYSNLLRQTPLHLAVLTGQDRLARRLVCAGAIVDVQDLRGETPLHIACRLGHHQMVKNLLTPVRYKELRENTWEIPYQRLPQDLGTFNCDGQTPLHVAAIAGHEDIVKLLLKSGADPNAGEAKSGRTALHLAAERGWKDLVQLIACSDDVDLLSRTYAGLTAAQLALGRNLDPIAHYLQSVSDDEVSDADSEMTVVGSDSDGEFWDEGME